MIDWVGQVRPVPRNMRLEMLVEMQIEILDGQISCLFSNEHFEKRPVTTIEDFKFVLHSEDHFESHLHGSELYDRAVPKILQGIWYCHVADQTVGPYQYWKYEHNFL